MSNVGLVALIHDDGVISRLGLGIGRLGLGLGVWITLTTQTRGRGYARYARSARSTHRYLQVPVADRVHQIVRA